MDWDVMEDGDDDEGGVVIFQLLFRVKICKLMQIKVKVIVVWLKVVKI